MNWSVFRHLALAWLVTMPAAALVAAVSYLLTTKPSPTVAAIVMGVVLVVLLVLLVRALKTAPKASDVAPGGGSIIDSRGRRADRRVLEEGGTLDEAEAAAREHDRRRLSSSLSSRAYRRVSPSRDGSHRMSARTGP